MRAGRILTLAGTVSLVGLVLTGVGTSQGGSAKLVFSTVGAPGTIELDTVDVETAKTTALTPHTPQGVDPAWSPDGRKLAFTAGEGEFDDFEPAGVWVVDANGQHARELAAREGDFTLYPRYSPDGKSIAFTDGQRLVVIDRNGGRRRLIARGHGIDAPSWSPDGKRIAFSTFDGVFVVTVRSGHVARVTRPQTKLEREAGFFWGPAWSPDGKRIAATKGWVDSYENTLIVVDADGGGQRSLGRGWDAVWISAKKIAVVLVHPTTGRGQGIRFVRADGRVGRTVNPLGEEFALAWAKRARRLLLVAQKKSLLRLYSVNPSRGPARMLTRPLGPVRGSPRWSPDGSSVAVESATRGNSVADWVFTIELLRPGGKSIRLLDPAVDSNPSPSPDGSRLVFARHWADQNETIVVMNADGSQPRRLATGTTPVWSRDGGRISFERKGAIYSMNADGSSQVRLAAGHSPSFSPDGSVVAFARGDAIYAVSATGGPATRLTVELCSGTASATRPAWSPDGTRIAFTLDCGGTAIVVMRSDGSNVKLLGSGTSPSWSPSGETIAFRAIDESDERWVYTMKPDGSARTPLAKGGRSAAWSPDGRRIAFERESPNGPGYDLYVINVDGSGERKVVESTAEDPDGEPLPIAWLR